MHVNATFVFWEAQLGMQPLTASRCLEMEETVRLRPLEVVVFMGYHGDSNLQNGDL